jgi:hypothetical protein
MNPSNLLHQKIQEANMDLLIDIIGIAKAKLVKDYFAD